MSNLEMLRKPECQSHDRQGWISVPRRREYRGTRDKQVLYSEHTAVAGHEAAERRPVKRGNESAPSLAANRGSRFAAHVVGEDYGTRRAQCDSRATGEERGRLGQPAGARTFSGPAGFGELNRRE